MRIQSNVSLSRLAATVAVLTAFSVGNAAAQECSIAKTNHNCTLTIDRKSPLAPPTIQMYPGQTLTVVVRNGYYFERYYLDFQSGQVTPITDITPIISGLVSNLAKLAVPGAAARAPGPTAACAAAAVISVPPATGADLYRQCFDEFGQTARGIYSAIEPAVVPDSRSPGLAGLPASNRDISTILVGQVPGINGINEAFAREQALSGNIAAALKTATAPADVVTLEGLSALAGMADAIAKDLFAYGQRISDLPPTPPPTLPDISLAPIPDPPALNASLVTRQVTYALTAVNLVQNTREAIPAASAKKTIASITLNFGDFRWEGSVGSMFSTLANRSFSVGAVIVNGVVTNKQVLENVLHPSVVPFAAANYRLSNDLRSPHWRMAWYWTFAVGGNPNTVSADFATGPSLSWRALMFSALWHVGHDVRATQGLYKGELLGTSYSGSVTTETYWRLDRVALGISVRVPALTGR